MCRSRIAGLYGNSVSSFLKNFHTVLHNDCTKLYSHQHGRRVLFSPCLLPTFIVHRFFDDGHADQCEVIFIVLMCISLIISYAEHLFLCFFPICLSSLEKCVFRSSVQFLIGLCFFFFFFNRAA